MSQVAEPAPAADASAAGAKPASAGAPDGAVALHATITGVEGRVQVRSGDDAKWQKAQVGMVVDQGAEFRTGPASAVRVQIPPGQTVTLDRLGTFKLLTALQEGNLVTTRVGMPYGRTRYDVEAAGVQHRSELVTPSSTLAVRSTRVSVYDQVPYPPMATSLTGRAVYSTAGRQVPVGNTGQGRTNVTIDSESPADLSLARSFVDPRSPFGRPDADRRVLAHLPSNGDLLLANRQSGLQPAGGVAADPALQPIFAGQGRFNIALQWGGQGDFDLFVLGRDAMGQAYTLGNPAYPGSVFQDIGLLFPGRGQTAVTTPASPDGGRIAYDRRTPRGRGIEVASWGAGNTAVPQQGFTIAIVYYDRRGADAGYPQRSDFRLDAFLDGRRLPVLVNYDEVARGTATELRYGPTYLGKASLVESEQVVFVPADKRQGDVRLSAVDLQPGAADLDGNPLGDINAGVEPGRGTVRLTARPPGKSGRTMAARAVAPKAAAKGAPVSAGRRGGSGK